MSDGRRRRPTPRSRAGSHHRNALPLPLSLIPQEFATLLGKYPATDLTIVAFPCNQVSLSPPHAWQAARMHTTLRPLRPPPLPSAFMAHKWPLLTSYKSRGFYGHRFFSPVASFLTPVVCSSPLASESLHTHTTTSPPPRHHGLLQFGAQEPGTNAEIKAFAAARGFTGAGAMLMDKIDVNGANASPVYNFLKVASGDTSDSELRAH